MATTAPSLGYGERDKADINDVNVWMGQQPWYRELLASFGQSPDNVHLSDSQKQQVIRAAQANGIVVDEGGNGQEVDDSGNFRAKGHKLRNTMIVAGIAAAALGTLGAAGVLGGAAGAGGAASGGTAAAGSVLPSTVIGTGAATLPAVAASGAVPAALGVGGATAAAVPGVLSKVGGLLGKGSVADTLGLAGKGISGALQSAGQTQLQNNELTANAAQINQRAEEARQAALENLSGQEREQRASDLTNLARQSFVTSGRASPFNPSGAPVQSASYLQGLSDIEKQALARLKEGPMYDPTKIAPKAVTPYTPNTSQSTLQKVGNIAAPVLTATSAFLTPKPAPLSVADALAPYLRYL